MSNSTRTKCVNKNFVILSYYCDAEMTPLRVMIKLLRIRMSLSLYLTLLQQRRRSMFQNFNSMDFSLSISNRHGNSGLNPADISIKSEPMDYETSSPYNSNARSADQDSLNAFGPQDATFHLEASAKSSDSSNADQQRGTSKDLKRSHYDDGKSTSANFCPDIKIEGGLNVKSEIRKEPSKTSIAIKLPNISSAGAGRSSGGGYKPPQTSSSSAKSSPSS